MKRLPRRVAERRRARLRLGWAGSLDASYWVLPRFGLRIGGTWAQDSLRGAALPGRGKFNKFNYDAALVLRYPIETGSATLSPYVLGGAGAISVHQLGASDTWSKFAGNFGAGLEYRFGRVGLRAEGRDFVYKFDRYGFDSLVGRGPAHRRLLDHRVLLDGRSFFGHRRLLDLGGRSLLHRRLRRLLGCLVLLFVSHR